MEKNNHEVIFAIVNSGFAEDVMDIARKLGVRGGTILTGRGVANEKAAKFFGITLHSEKEILMIACLKEKRNAIMDAIAQSHGVHSDEQAVLCSLPIDRLVRLA